MYILDWQGFKGQMQTPEIAGVKTTDYFKKWLWTEKNL